jgi:hypothetical protein
MTNELKNQMAKTLARFMVEVLRAGHTSRLSHLAHTLADKMESFEEEANKEEESKTEDGDFIFLTRAQAANCFRIKEHARKEESQHRLFNVY